MLYVCCVISLASIRYCGKPLRIPRDSPIDEFPTAVVWCSVAWPGLGWYIVLEATVVSTRLEDAEEVQVVV